MARIAGGDLPHNKRVEIALTYIFGIGRRLAQNICDEAGVDRGTNSDALSEEQLQAPAGLSLQRLHGHAKEASQPLPPWRAASSTFPAMECR